MGDEATLHCPSCNALLDDHCANRHCDWFRCTRDGCGGMGDFDTRWVQKPDPQPKAQP